MTASQAGLPIPRGVQLEVEELRERLGAMIAVVLMLIGAAMSLLLLPGPNSRSWSFWLSVSLFVEGVLSHSLRFQRPMVSRLILLLGPSVSYSVALTAETSPVVPFLAVVIVITNYSMSPRLGIAAALLSTASLSVLRFRGDLFLPCLALIWLSALTEWITSRGLYTALDWAWSSQRRATGLLRQLRDWQGELNRTVAALMEANRRLERVGYDLAVTRDLTRIIRPRGRIAMVGLFNSQLGRIDLDALVVNNITLKGSLGSPNVWEETIHLMETAKIRAGPLITERRALSEAAEVFQMMAERRPDLVKAVLVP